MAAAPSPADAAIDGESAIANNPLVDIDIRRVREDARRIIEHSGRTYSPLRIYQWGSLVETRNFSEISDIDIGVEGLSGPEQYFAMLGDATQNAALIVAGLLCPPGAWPGETNGLSILPIPCR